MDKQNEYSGIRIPKSPRVLYLFKTISDSMKSMTEEEKEDFCLTLTEIILMNFKMRRNSGQDSTEEKETE